MGVQIDCDKVLRTPQAQGFVVPNAIFDKSVTWLEFEQPHRFPKSRASWWRYDKLGPFEFERGHYEAMLTKAETELRAQQRIMN